MYFCSGLQNHNEQLQPGMPSWTKNLGTEISVTDGLTALGSLAVGAAGDYIEGEVLSNSANNVINDISNSKSSSSKKSIVSLDY